MTLKALLCYNHVMNNTHNPLAGLQVATPKRPSNPHPISPKQRALIISLVKEKDLAQVEMPAASTQTPEMFNEFLDTLTGGWGGTGSKLIDQLFAADRRPREVKVTPDTSDPDGLDLTHLLSGVYADPRIITDPDNEDIGYGLVRIDVVTKGKWDGYVFVKNGSEYKYEAVRYGTQRPGGRYQGKIEDQLERIAADPHNAARAFAQITGNCAICGRRLENEASVAAGIGPICAEKAGW